jgi:hypothetical protein
VTTWRTHKRHARFQIWGCRRHLLIGFEFTCYDGIIRTIGSKTGFPRHLVTAIKLMGDDQRVVRDDRIIGTLDRIVTSYRDGVTCDDRLVGTLGFVSVTPRLRRRFSPQPIVRALRPRNNEPDQARADDNSSDQGRLGAACASRCQALVFVFVRRERRETSAHGQADEQEPSREGAPGGLDRASGFPFPL